MPNPLARFVVSAPMAFLKNSTLGDSIAISGACMTITALTPESFSFDASPESLKKTILGHLVATPCEARDGARVNRVNLEKPVMPNQPMGGHFVTGHIDGLATLERIESVGECYQLSVRVDNPQLARLLVPKGSVTLDGISLTVNDIEDRPNGVCTFTVMIIPHTWANTTLKDRVAGDALNLETDLLGKYVARFQALPMSK